MTSPAASGAEFAPGAAPGRPRPPAAPRPSARAVAAHRLFEARAARSPDATALTCGATRLTYAELNARANRLAHHLRARGVRPDTLVGLLLDRSPELVVGLLGVLKAGGAYVPLDPAYPAARLEYMLADAGVSVLLTREALRDTLPPGAARVVALDDPAERIDWQPDANPDPAAGAGLDHLAYVIYTSGSTGRPKGAMITHRGLSNYLAWCVPAYRVAEGEGAPVHSSFSFDLTVTSLFAPLLAGRRVDLLDESLGVEQLAEALRRGSNYSLVKITPAHLQLLGRQLAPAEAAGRTRLFVVGGEQLTAEQVAFWREHAPETEIVNEYGPTETVVGCCVYTLPHAGEIAGALPIGRPIGGTSLYVLDARMQPVPVAVPGELYVGGAGVARGYLNRPGLTAEKFVPDPFGKAPGARLYRTGDLARWRPDGLLEFLGRADQQVKVRGHRVEPGEVEVALAAHPALRDAAVVAREAAPGDLRLVAYVVPADGPEPPTAADLRAFLRASLPEPFVPSAFVTLDALPLTPNGKVDRAALPEPQGATVAPGVPYEAPRGEDEEAVARVWSAVLGVERVGANDHFFDLGGHSLLATQVVSRLRDELGVELPLRALFEGPTVAGLAARAAEARARGAGVRPAPPIVPTSRGDDLPLSFAQQALWFIDRLNPGTPTFNVTAAAGVTGPLDLDALARAFRELVRRHEALRTTFEAVDGRPVPRVHDGWVLPLPVEDLTGLPESERRAEAARLADLEARAPFDLARGPLVRATLLRLGPDEHAVLLTMHHIVTDGWSFGVAAGELAALYDAYRRGLPSPLAEPAVQYFDYARWQRDWLSGPVLDGLLTYWTGRLAGVPPLELPSDRPRPPVRTARGEARGFALPAGLSAAVAELGRSAGATPFMTLLAAFQALLGRLSGQADFAVGSPIANRNRREVEGLIGYFVNMLALRADLSGDPTFLTLLDRVRDTALGAYEHQDLPFDVLVEALHPRRDPARTPVFQVMFVLQNTLMPEVDPGRLTLAPLDSAEGTGTAKFDLSLGMAETPDGLVGTFEFSTDLFDAATIDRLVGQFRAVLEQVTADPDRRLSSLALLNEAERSTLLDAWNATDAPRPAGARVHDLFEAQARRTPDAPAVIAAAGASALTYRELDAASNRLAHHLRALGAGPGGVVGVAVPRSPDLFVALLAVLKSGAAFLPLDPDYPADRLRLMLDDAGATAVVTRRPASDRLPATSAHRVDLDADAPAIAGRPDTAPESGVTPGHPAYVMYTSGSTGRPKGVVVTHRNVVDHNLDAARRFGLGPSDRVLQFCSVSFDIAVEEVFPAWASGAAVVLREDAHLDPSAFGALLARDAVTVVDLPTAFWHAWVKSLSARGERPPGCLRLVVVGGEAAAAPVLATWSALAGPALRWVNTYGPTETTVIATAFEPDDPSDTLTAIPIGRPVENTRAYVLDAHMNPTPVGVPGELYVGGAGVALGYLNRPKLTAEKFVPDPFGEAPGARLYRTGDRARWRPDGHLEFLGRFDAQLKVRGFRVEPGEVEAELLAWPGVRQAAVSAGPGGESLVAFVSGEADRPAPDVRALRRHLRDRLPRHLVPSQVVALDELPLTPAGKVDRDALPAPEAPSDPAAERRPPADETEARLVAIWEELLGVRPVGAADDFFELGGHSLLAIRLLARVEEEFGRSLPLAALLVGPTVEDLAARLRGGPTADAWDPLVPLSRGGPAARSLFCVHPGGGIVYCFRGLAERLGPGLPVTGLQASGLDAGTEPFDHVELMAARYVDALRVAQPEGPYRLAGWSFGGLVAYEMARQLVAMSERVEILVNFDTTAPPAAPADVPESLRELAEPIAALELFGPPGEADPLDDALVVAQYAGGLVPGTVGGLRRLITALAKLDPQERRRRFLREFGLDRVYHLDTGPGQVDRLLKVIRAHVLAALRYRPEPYGGPMTVFRCRGGLPLLGGDRTLGWGRLVGGGVTTHDVPGLHDDMLGPPAVDAIAARLRAGLGAAGGDAS